jgi:hypothetical protein
MAFELGELVWKITGDTSSIDKNIKKSQKTTEGFIGTIKKVGAAIAASFVVKRIISVGKALVNAASVAEETANKFAVTFKGIANESREAARSLAADFGLSQQKAQDLLASTGDLLTGFGFTRDSALGLSEQVQRLSSDLASFQNLQGGAEQASAALTKGLLGERESLKTLGIVIREADIAQELLIQGKANLTGESLLQAKAEATLQIALRQSKNAIGDFARSQESLANQSRISDALIQDIQVSLGNILLPVVAQSTKNFNEFAKEVKSTTEEFEEFTKSAEGARLIGDIFGRISGALNVLKTLITPVFNALIGAYESALSPLIDLATETFEFIAQFFEFGEKGAIAIGIVTKAVTGLSLALEIVGRLGRIQVQNFINIAKAGFAVQKAIARVLLAIKDGLTLKELREIAKDTGDTFKDLVIDFKDNALDIFNTAKDGILSFNDDSKKLAKDIEASFKSINDSVSRNIQDLLKKTKTAAGETGEELGDALDDVISTISKTELISNLLGGAAEAFSIISELSSNLSNQRLEEIEKQRQAALEAAGVAEETERERSERELQEAIDNGDAIAEAEARTAITRARINEEFERKRAEESYKASLVQWQLTLASSIASGAQAVLNGFATQPFLPAGLAAGGLATTLSALQIATVATAKPQKPQFAVGALDVPRDMDAVVHQGEAIIPAPFAESVRRGEIDITGGGGSKRPITIQLVTQTKEVLYEQQFDDARNGVFTLPDTVLVRT